MSVPTLEQNVVASHVYPTTDLGIPVTVGNGATVTGTQFNTGMPASLVVLCQLVTGAGTLNVQVGASGFTPTYSGGTNTALTLSVATLAAAVVNTAFVYDDTTKPITLSTDQRFVATQVVNTNGGNLLTFSKFVILVCYELTPGEDWFLGLRSSCNAVANRTVGDGGGLVYLGPDYSQNPYYPAGSTRNPGGLL